MLPPLSDLPSEADQQLQRAYAMCMKMSPICGDDGPLVRGINKLSALLDTASCERLAQVPLVTIFRLYLGPYARSGRPPKRPTHTAPSPPHTPATLLGDTWTLRGGQDDVRAGTYTSH